MGFWGDVGDWFSTAGGKVYDAGAYVVGGAAHIVTHPIESVTNAAEATWSGIKSAGSAIADAHEWTVDKVATGMGHTINGVEWVIDNPQEALEGTWHGLKVAGQETWGFTKYVATHPWEATKLGAQGLQNAALSTVGMVGDVGVAVYNNTLRHVVNTPAHFLNLGFKDGDKIKTFDKFEHNYMRDLPAVATWMEIDANDPNAKYQRVVLYGTQAVGEIGAFVGVSVLTAGAGSGAYATAWAGARGTAYVARGTSALVRGERLLVAGVEAAEGVKALSTGARITGAFSEIVDATIKGGKAGYRFSAPVYRPSARAGEWATKAAEKTAHAAKLLEGGTEAAGMSARVSSVATNAEKFGEAAGKLATKADGLASTSASQAERVAGLSQKMENAGSRMSKAVELMDKVDVVAMSKAAKDLHQAGKLSEKSLRLVEKIIESGDRLRIAKAQLLLDTIGGGVSFSFKTYEDIKKGDAAIEQLKILDEKQVDDAMKQFEDILNGTDEPAQPAIQEPATPSPSSPQSNAGEFPRIVLYDLSGTFGRHAGEAHTNSAMGNQFASAVTPPSFKFNFGKTDGIADFSENYEFAVPKTPAA